jgi:predicted signal transduction protein with EAL and GGDEF domain
LTGAVRETDTVSRLGGDEFVVLLADLGHDPAEAAAAVESIGSQILAVLTEPFVFGRVSHRGSASVGLTVFGAEAGSLEDVLKQADVAMYRAKESGGGACRFFDPQIESAMRDRAVLESDLLRAVAENEFELYFQPQSDLAGRVKGAEALIRWHHPERGLVMPAGFIPFAEETGLIVTVGRWVLEAACRELVRWQSDPHLAGLRLAVNVSSRQFQEPGFADDCLATLARTGARPDRLDLELTESLLVTDVDAVIAKMGVLRAAGVAFTLDDFGTGYSSLAYLKRMPLDQLKIDRAFVQDILTDPNDAAIAETIVALARALSLRVIAEGVESEAQRDYLALSGCADFQGYFFSRPLPAAEFAEFVRRADAAAGATPLVPIG